MSLFDILILFVVGVAAGFLNVIAGGGSVFTLPALIFLGLDSSLANGTNRIAVFAQSVFAVASFKRKKLHQFKLSSTLALLTLPGAVAGALIAIRVSDALFQRILGVVMILVVISLFLPPPSSLKISRKNGIPSWLLYPVLVGIGFYGGFLQVGVGFLFMAALYHLLLPDLVKVNMHKVFIIMLYTVPALIVFALTGNVDWKLGIALGAGNSLGGWWGARVSVVGGEKVIRTILALSIIIMALKLFGAY